MKSKSRNRSFSKSKIRTRVVHINSTRSVRSNLSKYEDRRLWHPERNYYADAKSFNSTRHRLVYPSVNRQFESIRPRRSLLSQINSAIAFAAPKKVLICVRRKIRKSVLHALGKTGRGGQKSPRFSYYSSIQCKR